MKIKIDVADRYFSMYIRLRDKECKRCHEAVTFNQNGDPISHQASHFQSRRKESTRFDPDNVDTLCGGCHLYFTAHPFDHVKWQIETKGQPLVTSLVMKSRTYCKKDRPAQAKLWKTLYIELKSVA